jgi:hypothetical protein
MQLLKHNSPAIKRAERLVTSCYVEIAPPSINLRWPKEEPDCRVGRYPTQASGQVLEPSASWRITVRGGYAVPRRAERDGGACFWRPGRICQGDTSVVVQVARRLRSCHGVSDLSRWQGATWICHGFENCLGSRKLFAKTLSDWRSQAGVTTAPAIALAKAGQLTFIVRVSC